MKVGIIGLPNVGKSSLFNLLTSSSVSVAEYPFTTIDPNCGMVVIPDEKLNKLAEVLSPEKVTPAMIEFVDVAGLVKNAHKGEGLGNQFLSHIRDVDLVVHVLRTFGLDEAPFIYDTIDPKRDKELVEAELALADLEIIEKRLKKIEKDAGRKEEKEILENFKEKLVKGERVEIKDEKVQKFLKGMGILSYKPFLYVINSSSYNKWEGWKPDNAYLISCKLENEMRDFSEEEKREMRRELGLDERGIEGIVEEVFKKLGLIRFYTIKGKEIRAWVIKRGTTVYEAAGKIHSDIQRGFIKAEVIPFERFMEYGDYRKAHENGAVQIEGRDYIVKDEDIILIKFKI